MISQRFGAGGLILVLLASAAGMVRLQAQEKAQAETAQAEMPQANMPPSENMPPPTAPLQAADFASVRLLNKITAHNTLLRLAPGRPQREEALRMRLQVCYAEPAPARGFVEIETAGGALLFQGWMIADAPGLNPFMHPIYDVWLTGCSQAGAARGEGAANSTAAAAASASASRR